MDAIPPLVLLDLHQNSFLSPERIQQSGESNILGSHARIAEKTQKCENLTLLEETLDLQSIINEFAERVYNHAYRMIGSREDAEEATQDIFLRIHQGLPKFRG